MKKRKPWETLSGYIQVPADRAKKADCAFVVTGDSLEPLLYDGDHVLVESVSTIGHGEIGAFWVNNHTRIMRMHKENGENKLLPLNYKYPEVDLTADVTCIGRVVGRA